MPRLETKVKRTYLRTTYDRAVAGSVTLLSLLSADAAASITSLKGGSIQATSGNGVNVQFAQGTGASTQDGWAGWFGEALDRYDQAKAALIAEGIPTPTDAQIYTRMLDCLATTRDFVVDLTGGAL